VNEGRQSSDLTHSSCDNVTVPDTTLGKVPPKRGTKHKGRATFTSTVPSATFECSLDQRAFKACISPYKASVEMHILKVQAVGPAGVADPTPASVVFRVLHPPH
jgi:hypothetical protein